ncbi:hypothetical protein [uncultured Clostridium sp.]|uniref:hypothetical protein n=1 Tax=uncultured Clostridium sp. TaxID=59620 RepID=UPI0025940C6F|nr:hypothetical protein [uncultured Clostridium sp.]
MKKYNYLIFFLSLGIISFLLVLLWNFIEDNIVDYVGDISPLIMFLAVIFLVIMFFVIQINNVSKKSKVDKKTAFKYVLKKFIKGKY